MGPFTLRWEVTRLRVGLSETDLTGLCSEQGKNFKNKLMKNWEVSPCLGLSCCGGGRRRGGRQAEQGYPSPREAPVLRVGGCREPPSEKESSKKPVALAQKSRFPCLPVGGGTRLSEAHSRIEEP